MPDNPLFYQDVVLLNRETHRDLVVAASEAPFGFARTTNMIPALAEEFGAAALHMPIVFVPGASKPSPIFLVGLRSGKNDFVSDEGRWAAGYLPAYLRRYPFIIGEQENGGPLICIDEKSSRLAKDGGERLFDQESGDTPFLKDQIKFANDYFAAAKLTDALVDRLVDLNLFRSISIESKKDGVSNAAIHGLLAVDEAKLAALPDEKFLRLRQNGLLGPVYAHLISLGAAEKLSAAF